MYQGRHHFNAVLERSSKTLFMYDSLHRPSDEARNDLYEAMKWAAREGLFGGCSAWAEAARGLESWRVVLNKVYPQAPNCTECGILCVDFALAAMGADDINQLVIGDLQKTLTPLKGMPARRQYFKTRLAKARARAEEAAIVRARALGARRRAGASV